MGNSIGRLSIKKKNNNKKLNGTLRNYNFPSTVWIIYHDNFSFHSAISVPLAEGNGPRLRIPRPRLHLPVIRSLTISRLVDAVDFIPRMRGDFIPFHGITCHVTTDTGHKVRDSATRTMQSAFITSWTHKFSFPPNQWMIAP